MNSDQFARWLKRQGVEVTAKKAGDGHRALYNPATEMISQLPVHGGSKQLRTSVMEKIKKELGLK
ncbi:addiction module toxin, HicA family [Azospirillum palustre]|uniref:Addiction module toxin, HicA family n=1 Tax=Azospirillum palustre TaxID=2044885 RepID=A0A2B8BPA8_9PROT|nr:addiction module toxin, HicA family [Azospirillum palustre]PGH59067.1 addiction module toxin, HicA family [Azospirillum palustre]